MAIVFQKTRLLFLCILFGVLVFSSLTAAEEASVFNEFTADYSWLSDDYSYNDYVVNGVPLPSISGSFRSDYQRIQGTYSLFFTPIVEDETIPIVLRRFYAHPSTLYLNFSVEPENESSHIHQNSEQNYRAVTIEERQSRNAAADFTWYLARNTGLLFHVRSAKKEDTSEFSNTLETRGSGRTDEIRRYYGAGLSQYLFEDLHLSFLYTIFDFEYISIEETWEEDSPLLRNEAGREADTDGKELSITGKYILNKQFGMQAAYTYMDFESHSKTVSWSYNNFPVSETFFSDNTTSHTLGASVDFYWRKKTAVRLGGHLTWYKIRREYDTDQIVDYTWDIWGIHSSLLYYLNRHLGIRLGYEFSKQDGNVETWHPETENDPRTTFQADSDVQAIQLGLIGRF